MSDETTTPAATPEVTATPTVGEEPAVAEAPAPEQAESAPVTEARIERMAGWFAAHGDPLERRVDRLPVGSTIERTAVGFKVTALWQGTTKLHGEGATLYEAIANVR